MRIRCQGPDGEVAFICKIGFTISSTTQINSSMAPAERKRIWPDKVSKPRKRQRADTSAKASKQPITKTNVVSLDALSWTEVAVPDRFEDAEGFFGLEEIEDVEVVRDIDLGKLEYRVALKA